MPRARSLRSLVIGPKRTASSPGPPSPTFSDTTQASAVDFGPDGPEKIITRSNLKASLQAYEDLMSASASYRASLLSMSKTTAAFADALERCSGLKGPPYEAKTRLQAASGIHHLLGNQWHILAETLDKSFEKPLRQHLDNYRLRVNERSAAYEKTLYEISHVIRQTEMRSMNRKQRNLQSFREALAALQRQVDELDHMKLQYYREILEHEQEVWEVVQGKVCLVVRSSMDVFDRFTAKASDPIIEPMLQSVPDPFDSYGPPQSEDQIFSILHPLSIMTGSAPSPSSSSHSLAPESATIEKQLTLNDKSWIPSDVGYLAEPTLQWGEVSSPSTTSPRSVSPPSVFNATSTPTSSKIRSRQSESKLKSVLNSIDETSYSQDQQVSEDVTQDIQNSDGKNSWRSFTYGQSPCDNFDDSTPRNSAYLATPEQEPNPLEERGKDPFTLHPT